MIKRTNRAKGAPVSSFITDIPKEVVQTENTFSDTQILKGRQLSLFDM